MGKAYQIPKSVAYAGIKILDVREDPNHRLTTSPFGITPEQYENDPPLYYGRSAPWKGIKGLGIEGFGKALIAGTGLHGKISMANRERLLAGLKRAIAISKKCAGVTGTELFAGKLYPSKCIAQMREAGKIK